MANAQDQQNPDRGVSIPHRDHSVSVPDRYAQAAANIAREQINTIYNTSPPNQPAQQDQEQNTHANPYQRTHSTDPKTYWHNYHSAWQNYYQQYYQRYYHGQLQVHQQKIQAEKASDAAKKSAEPVAPPKRLDPKKQIITGHNPDAQNRLAEARKEATAELKSKLVSKVQERAKKVRRSHHFMPIVSALAVGLIFVFLQYNRFMAAQVKAYVSPGSQTNDSIIVEPTANVAVGPEPKLIIPKINVDVPVVYGIKSLENDPVQAALRGGVVHYPLPGANAVPGQVGNSVVLGHSSNDVFDAGAYKFAFVLLDRLEKEDVFYMNYQGKRYIYQVTDKKIISPNELNALQVSSSKPLATLVTCTPPGTALKRLVVYAEQISPDPNAAAKPGENTDETKPSQLPGYSPTLLDNIVNFFTS